jgi:bis(5'-nucleosyl)-tetraphosphatase (symmetrical)
MATWAIGDVQGCMSSLEALLDRVGLGDDDQVWLVGDLVNRGPRSLDVLRWAMGLGERAVCVLGNHDVHLLARAAGVADEKKRDTLDEILRAPDRDALIDWLRRRPLVHVDDDYLMVHAGLHPTWSAKKARKLASEIEEGLRGDDWKSWIAQLPGKVVPWDDDLGGATRLRAMLQFFLRVRCIDRDGVANTEFDDHPRYAGKGLTPWFDADDPAWSDSVIVFGHWAALGLNIGVRHLGLDSGCVWGHQLTAVRLEDELVVQVKAVEARPAS